MASKKRYLTGEQRLILEENGVIDAPQVPRSDQLEESIRMRGWGLDVAVSAKGFATAKVKSGHGSFDGAGDHSDVAIVEALCATLKSRPRKVSLFDPAVPQAPGVETEQGPVEGGAPAAEWAEPTMGDYLTDSVSDEEGDALIAAYPDDPEPSEETRADDLAIRLDVIRAEFGTKIKKGVEVCKRCGIRADQHPLDVCSGTNLYTAGGDYVGTNGQGAVNKSGQIRSGAQDAESGESAITGDDLVLGQLSASPNGNGSHDPADFDTPNLDPDRVTRTLAERGWEIAFETSQQTGNGLYVNPHTGFVYDTGDVEQEYRSALVGRAR